MDKAAWVKKISSSKLSVKQFFEKNPVPFGISQYYRYKKLLSNGQPILDNRKQGNNRILSPEQEMRLRGYLKAMSNFTIQDVAQIIHEQFGDNFPDRGGLQLCSFAAFL